MYRLLALACVLAPPLAAQQLTLPLTAELLDSIAKEKRPVAHAVVAVDRDGRSFVRTVGFADPESERPFESWAYVPVGALSRVVTRIAFEAMVRDVENSTTATVGASVAGLPDEVARLPWPEVFGGSTSLPCFARWLPTGVSPRAPRAIVDAHAFLASPELRNHARSMTPWALAQVALEAHHDASWDRLITRVLRDEVRCGGIRAERALPAHLLVVGHSASGEVAPRRFAEVDAAAGAALPVASLATLLQALATNPARTSWLDGTAVRASGSRKPIRVIDTTVAGVSSGVVVREDDGVAMFVFVGQMDPEPLRRLVAAVHQDLELGGAAELFADDFALEEIAEAEPGPGPCATAGTWRGTLDIAGESVAFELDITVEGHVRMGVDGAKPVDAPALSANTTVTGWVSWPAMEGRRLLRHIDLDLALRDGTLAGALAVATRTAAGIPEPDVVPCRVVLRRAEAPR